MKIITVCTGSDRWLLHALAVEDDAVEATVEAITQADPRGCVRCFVREPDRLGAVLASLHIDEAETMLIHAPSDTAH
jgi:hypothetical protein